MPRADRRHAITRVRREPRRRTLTVASIEPLGGSLRRIRFACGDLGDFDSDAPDDPVKLFLPGCQEDGRSTMRDYTPRAFDRAEGTITIDFALHGDGDQIGPATAWALAAVVGDTIQIGGPRGSTIVRDDFDWYLLIGDESAIPAISRRIEELRRDAAVLAIVSVLEGDQPPIMPDHPGLVLRWSPRTETADGGAGLLATLAEVIPPVGDGFVWIAAEAAAARAARTFVVTELDHPGEWIKASGYWLAGARGTHAKIGEE